MTTTTNNTFPSWRTDGLAITALLLFVAVLFHALPSGYWRADDPAIIWHAMNSKGLNAFYNPADWQKLSPNNLTPWLTLSFKADLWLAGLSPKFLYIHSTASLMLVMVAAYILNRHWMPPLWASLSVFLFLTGAPTTSVTELLMTRHYMEGLLFALLSVIAFVQAMRRQQIRWAVVGAVLYALAAAAKEIYVPLVFVVFLLPPFESFNARLRLIAPYVAVAVLYVIWRRFMLGAMVGGYGSSEALVSLQSLMGMATALLRFPVFFFGPSWFAPTAILFIALCRAAVTRPLQTPMFAMLAVCVIAPLVPLVAFPGLTGPDRYLFLVWFAACFTGTLAIHALSATLTSRYRVREFVGIFAVLVVGSISYSNTLELQKSRAASYREFDTQGRFYFAADQRQGFIPSQTLLHGFWYITNLCDIKKRLNLECPAALIKGVATEQPIERLFVYDPLNGTMANISDKLELERANIESIDLSRPLQASISVSNGVGRWDLGPYDQGQYFFASPHIGRYPVPKNGSLKTQLTHLAFYIQYESPDGWTTSSPLLVAGTEKPVAWKR
jgi:hypothetical protein